MYSNPWYSNKDIGVLFFPMGFTEMIKIKWYDNTSITIVEHDGKGYKVILEGDVSHLGKEFTL